MVVIRYRFREYDVKLIKTTEHDVAWEVRENRDDKRPVKKGSAGSEGEARIAAKKTIIKLANKE